VGCKARHPACLLRHIRRDSTTRRDFSVF
jgi:hypothetical protein